MIRWLLLAALIAVLWRLARAVATPVPRPTARGPASATGPPRGPAWDPWRVLGLRPGAPRDEVTAAYRELMKRYHPDRVADLGDELRRVAHEKTVEIQRAYDELMR